MERTGISYAVGSSTYPGFFIDDAQDSREDRRRGERFHARMGVKQRARSATCVAVSRQGLYKVTAADIHGSLDGPGWESSLIDRVRRYWLLPIAELPDAALALFLRQRIAVGPVLAEARRRLAAGQPDGSELYDDELAAAVEAAVGGPGEAEDPPR